MANEYLKRTPTSTGNRKIFTYAGWFKKNNANGSDRFDIFNAYNTGSQEEEIGFRADALRYLSSGSSLYGFDTTNKYRDTGNWFHIVFALNTTLESQRKRSVIYINGVEVDTTTSSGIGAYVAKNFDSIAFNVAGKEHNVLARKYSSSGRDYVEGGGFDIFFVDGQALTPDVFGFFKDGKGYQSSGTTQATDFRPGQWSPHSPRKIKTEIERKGGFGTNGFYLPMNDSSNFGADFHCTPNSIITLKGEDLPQPRNGAPTTSDAYVSQLRSDPYAANLVLAVPGISTATGANLVTNGTFDTNTTGWTAQDATLSVDNGRIKVLTTNTNYGSALQTVTGLTVGQRYTFQVDMYHGNASLVTAISGASPSINSGWQSADYVWRTSFTATTTSLVIDFQMASQSNVYGFWDNVILKAEDAPRDYSADIKGSGTNKTITANGQVGVGYELGGYYGSAMTFDGTNDYLQIPDSEDFNMGTGDFTLECWVNSIDDSDYQGIFGSYDYDNAQVTFQLSNSGVLRFVNPSAISPTGSSDLQTGQWNHIVMERYNGRLYGYANGVAEINIAYTSSIDWGHSNNSIVIGVVDRNDYPGQYEYKGSIQDLRLYKGVAKYKGGFDVPKPYTPVNFGGDSWRTVSDTCKNNFCTLNSLDTSQLSTSNGNLSINQSSGGWHSLLGTHYVRSGKWYAEMRIDRLGWIFFGVEQTWLETRTRHVGGQTGSKGVGLVYNTGNRGDITYNGTNNAYTGGDATAATGDIISIALDLDNNNIKFYKNNVLQYNLSNILESGADYAFGISPYSNVAVTVNFGQNSTFSGVVTAGTHTDGNGKGLFKYQPPAGYLALCEDNLPTPTIADPGEHFKTVLYEGDGNAGRSIRGVGFKPDFVWIGNRDRNTYKPVYDSICGATYMLRSNTTDTQTSYSTVLNSFDSDGFTVGTDSAHNGSGEGIVAWCWKAGGVAVTNNDGQLTTQVSANQTAGFSVVTWLSNAVGSIQTLGHGLGKSPDFIIVKNRDYVYDWFVWHKHLANTTRGYLKLNSSDDETTGGNDTWSVSSTTFGLRQSSMANANTDDFVAYCWAEIEGYSKFGSYLGNGNSDGPFVYCGFKPAWVLIKRTTTDGYYWTIYDNARKPTNPVNHTMTPDQTNSEVTNGGNGQIDFLSNGFKCRNTDGGLNASSVKYVFAAFAESPFQTASAK